eukprot:TRINITY_DN7483_c0_g1_i1.p1 TRINITY_DN7483_c0_g1~~TRINITY_DN7483_c0_g1_i1.p1  ORF type:complete len:621 (-),score=132.57 TRINITY_DN7483_c0_g1_i1:102-1763(-)
MKGIVFIFALLLVHSSLILCDQDTTKGTVYYNTNSKSYSVTFGTLDPTGVCYGYFESTLNSTGWGVLELQSNYKYEDSIQGYGCGYLEGALTHSQVWVHYNNIIPILFDMGPVPTVIVKFLTDQYSWAKNKVESFKNETASNPEKSYWTHVGYFYDQLEGVAQAYQDFAPSTQALALSDFIVLNSAGDLFDLVVALNTTSSSQQRTPENYESFKHQILFSHCSALIKVTDDLSDLFFGHSSWFVYSVTDRIYKILHLNFTDSSTKAKTVSFSSYPGVLNSFDDFYVMDTGLVAIETTISVFNTSIYTGNVKPETLPCGTRTVVSNRMSKDGEDWSKYFSLYNSGTYNNQWILVSTQYFQPGVAVGEGTLWILEQLPGLIHAEDMSDTLGFSYWPSYNVPYFKNMFNAAGYPPYAKVDPNELSYETCVRANIFRRDQGNVNTITDFMDIMRYNDWQNDPLSLNNPCYAIASRCDLSSGSNAFPFGAYDTKASSVSTLGGSKGVNVYAINGPTAVQQTPFTWNDVIFENYPQMGLPETYDFEFQLMTPKLQPKAL